MIKNIFNFTKNIYKYLGKKLILDVSLMTLKSLMNGTGLILIIPLLSVAGIINPIDSNNFFLINVQEFFLSLSPNLSLIIILILFICILSFNALLNRHT